MAIALFCAARQPCSQAAPWPQQRQHAQQRGRGKGQQPRLHQRAVQENDPDHVAQHLFGWNEPQQQQQYAQREGQESAPKCLWRNREVAWQVINLQKNEA